MMNPMNGCSDDDHKSTCSLFSCDLMTNATKHLEFLKSIHEYYITLNDQNCNHGSHESLRRYQDLWLPLVAKTSSKEQLYPPPDIAWLWHCHRLAPKYYTNYCLATFGGRIIEAHPPFEMAHPTAFVSDIKHFPLQEQPNRDRYFQRTMDLWTGLYPHESFFLEVNNKSKSIVETKLESTSPSLFNGFDLLGSTERQANFLWQVSGERFGDDDFLREGVLNYYRFLRLMPNARKHSTILVPTYQIDLIWHTHMLSSIEMYNKDCIRIMKSKMDHDDSPTDRDEGGVLDVSFETTKNLWIECYGTDYVIAGGMYRGEPPPEYYTSQWRSFEDSLPSTITNIALIGKVGASSTGETTNVPTQWAPLYGTASDGSPAFIKSAIQSKYSNRHLNYKLGYVFGRYRYGCDTGYYHIETRAANEILKKRVEEQLSKIEGKIAFQKSCCGPLRSVQGLESKRDELLQCQSLLQERLAALMPTGFTKTKRIGSIDVSGDKNTWVYPPILYDSAGGACGGVVSEKAGGSGMYSFQIHHIWSRVLYIFLFSL